METINKEELEYVQQQSDQWRLERQGKFTASEFYRLVADEKRPMTEEELASRPKGSTAKTIADPTLLSDGAITYIEEVLAEMLTGDSQDSDYRSPEMEHGILYEPVARRLYERTMGVKVTEVGSIPYRPLEGFVSGSSDGIIGKLPNPEGGIEVKCPFNNQIHIANMRLDNVWKFKAKRKEYFWQCIGGMLLTGAKYWDFVSYSPNFPLRLSIHVVRLNYQDVEEEIRHLSIKLKMAVQELKSLIEKFEE